MLHNRSRRAAWSCAPLFAALLALAVLVPAPPVHAQAQPTPEDLDLQVRAIKREQRRVLMAEPLSHLKRGQERAEALRKAMRKHKHGVALKKAPVEDEPLPVDESALAPAPAWRASAQQAFGIPTNVLVNNPAGDIANSGQSEQAIASLGSYVLVAWNDGQGFVSGPDVQGWGYSLDGGASFTDGGMVPRQISNGDWSSDPVVAVNEKTGDFWYCGLYDSTTAYSGVGVIKATFSPSGVTWGKEHLVSMLSNSSYFIDKEWMVADSSTGNLYLTFTKFTVADDSIMFCRSTDGGVTWSIPVVLSDPATAGYQQGSRPVVGPNGEVYVVWSEIGPSYDYIMIRKSTDHGLTFSPQVTAAMPYNNFGTGAPGFNRERSVDYPSIAVDRTNGPNRGRVWMTWHETVNWYFDNLGTGTNKNEVEPDNAYTSATPFTIGQTLRGTFANTSDQDWFSFTGTAGQSYIFAVDSIPRPLYSARVYCTDGVTKLTFTGLLQAPAGYASYMVFTAPATATYYFRMLYYTGASGGSLGGYRVRTAVHTPGATVGRDQRDAIVSHSDDGTSWSAPVRVNDDAALYDEWLPEVAVGADGMPYVIWFDWRDSAANCAGSSNIYASRSTDGGATWQANQKTTSALSPWSVFSANIAPNQGDYNFLYADNRYVRPSWADGRNASTAPDVYATAIDTWFTLSGCAADTSLHAKDVLNLTASVTNNNPLFTNGYSANVTTNRNWPSSPAPLTVAAASSGSTPVTLTVPDTSAAGTVIATLSVTNATGTLVRSCSFNVTVLPNAAVGPDAYVFGLRQNSPNPSHGAGTRIDYSLPHDGKVRLEVFGLNGDRVRTLVDGPRPAGTSTVVWDGRDDHGNSVHAGTYFYRLRGLGQTAVRRMVVLP